MSVAGGCEPGRLAGLADLAGEPDLADRPEIGDDKPLAPATSPIA